MNMKARELPEEHAGVPRVADDTVACDPDDARPLMRRVERLYPICRSITGDGVRQTLDILEESIPLQRHEVPTGTQVFDWEIPREWNIRDAWIRDPSGRTVVSLADHNLHVLNYSAPIHRTVALDELRRHVFTLPDQPTVIPYRTSYYRETWGFCMRHDEFETLADGDYEVMIDSTLEPGSLTIGECVIPGETDAEILLSTHICHPSMCNDNLSGITVLTELCRWLSGRRNRYTWRAVFAPGTIGSLTWLWLRQKQLDRIHGGLVLCGLGDPGEFTYKQSREGDSEIDRVCGKALANSGIGGRILPFIPYGYDERQYCSPGFALPVGRLSRTPYGEYPEYHTSADDLEFISEGQLAGALALCKQIMLDLEANRRWLNLAPCGEPCLGKRGLYGGTGGVGPDDDQLAMLWILNLSDGSHSLLDVAERSGLSMSVLGAVAQRLHEAGLLAVQTVHSGDPIEATDGGHSGKR